MSKKLLGIIIVDSIITFTMDQILHSADTREKMEYNGTVHRLFIDLKKAYESVKREVLHSILLEFGIPKKLVRLIKMCLNETYR
jgi:hypothetical protein